MAKAKKGTGGKQDAKRRKAKGELSGKKPKAAARSKARRASRTRKSGAARFSRSTLQKFRDMLISIRERITGDFMSLRNTHLRSSHRDSSGDLSGYSLHMADMGTDTFDREFGLSVASSEQDILYLIDRALKRIDEKTYGRCEVCGCAIKMTRLKAVPWTEMCIRCKEAEEKRRGTP